MTVQTRASAAALRAKLKAARLETLNKRASLIGAVVLPQPTRMRAKFNNTKTVYLGETFDSLGEAEHAWKLEQRRKKGEIQSWGRCEPVVLVDAPRARDRVTYRPDFWVMPAGGGKSHYIDYKGSKATETSTWRLKVKLWKKSVPFELRVAYPTGEEKVVATGVLAA